MLAQPLVFPCGTFAQNLRWIGAGQSNGALPGFFHRSSSVVWHNSD
jgi:hypothetical protein